MFLKRVYTHVYKRVYACVCKVSRPEWCLVEMSLHLLRTLCRHLFVDTFVDTLEHMFVDMFLIYKESCAMETTTGVARSFITTMLVVQSSNSGSVARCRLGRRLCANRGTKVTWKPEHQLIMTNNDAQTPQTPGTDAEIPKVQTWLVYRKYF